MTSPHLLVFSSVHTNAFVTDLFVRGGYGELGGVFVVERGRWEYWVPAAALQDAGAEGLQRMSVSGFMDAYEIAAIGYAEAVRACVDERGGLANASAVQVRAYLGEFVDRITRLLRHYRDTEYIYFADIERRLNAAASAEEVARWTHLIQYAGAVRLRMRETINQAFLGDGCQVALDVAFERLTAREDFSSLTCDEALAALEGGEVESGEPRQELLAVFRREGRWHYDSADPARAWVATLRAQRGDSDGTVRGTVASRGSYVGTVRVYEYGTAPVVHRFRFGDVLVAPTTGPEFMPLLAMAGAVVTDEGGLMSHGAIVAREHGLPCIVGTRHGTRMLRDGECVLVDAIEGVVRPLVSSHHLSQETACR